MNRYLKSRLWPWLLLAGLAFPLACVPSPAGETAPNVQGQYFAKPRSAPQPLPRFEATRERLPSPVYDERPEWVAMYWKAWELAFRNFHEPAPASGFVSQFIDAAFNQNIFLWDTSFLTMFCNVAHPLVPGIASLDNFYAKQHADGEICREIGRADGRDFPPWVNTEGRSLFSRWGWHMGQPGLPPDREAPVVYQGRAAPEPAPRLTLDALNHPILAWAEVESHRVTGDTGRLARVYEPLTHYYRALQKYLRQGNGLYITDWASMDNSPRNPHLKGGGIGVDISCEMALFARNLAAIAETLGKTEAAAAHTQEAEALSRLINEHLWDPERQFYFGLTREGRRAPVKTIAAFWALVSGVASPAQAEALVAQVNNPATFKRRHRLPTLAADEPAFDPVGGYWRGAVWAPTTTMVIRGLERYGFEDLARDIALNHLELVGHVFEATGTIWENYAADAVKPGRPAKKDFVGWSGLGPILYLLEYALGLQPDAAANELRWTLHSPGRQGCEQYRFNGHVVSLRAEAAPGAAGRFRLSVQSDGAFKLIVRRGEQQQSYRIKSGEQTLSFP